MKDKHHAAALLAAAKKWEPIKQLVASLRPAALACKVTFGPEGATIQLTIPWAEVPPDLLSKEERSDGK